MEITSESLRLTVRVTGDLARYVAALPPGKRAEWARDALQAAMEREAGYSSNISSMELIQKHLNNQQRIIELLQSLPGSVAQSILAAIAASGITTEQPLWQPEIWRNDNENEESAANWQPKQQLEDWQPEEWQPKRQQNGSQSIETSLRDARVLPIDREENVGADRKNGELAAKRQPEDRGSQNGSSSQLQEDTKDEKASARHIRVSGEALNRMAKSWMNKH